MSEEIYTRAKQLLEKPEIPACEMVACYQELRKLIEELRGDERFDLYEALSAMYRELAAKLFSRRSYELAALTYRMSPLRKIVEDGRYLIELSESDSRWSTSKYCIHVYYYSSEGCFDLWQLILDHASELKFQAEHKHYPMLFGKEHAACAIEWSKVRDEDYKHDASGSCFRFPKDMLDEFFPLPEDIGKKGHGLCYYQLIVINCPEATKLVQDFNDAFAQYKDGKGRRDTLIAAEKALHKREGNTDDLDTWTRVFSLLPRYWLNRENAEKKYRLDSE